MGDHHIVAIVAGDQAGLAVAYDSYAASLHAYCATLLAEPADAADAVQDTFVIAAARLGGLLGGLPGRDRLRPWLYAVARNECHGRLRDGAWPADQDEATEMTGPAADAGVPADGEELRMLVLDAIGGMSPGDREIIELNLRHDLDGADLADVLGVPPSRAGALAARARGRLERSLGALLVARSGRGQCAELDAIVDSWDGRLAIVRRKRASKHIEACDTCGARKLLELSPAMLRSVLPLMTLPFGLREKVMWLVSDPTAGTARYRSRVLDRVEPFSPSGFPVQIAPADLAAQSRPAGDADGPGAARGRGRPRSRTLVLCAVVLLGGCGAAAYLLLGGTGPGTAARHPSAAAGPLTVPPALSARGPASRPPSSASAAVVPPPADASSPSPAAPGTSAPSVTSSPATSSPPARPTHAAVRGTLSAAPTTIALTQGGGPYSATFTLTAARAPVTFAIVVPASESYLSASPASGTVNAGHSQTVTITLTPDGRRTPYTSTVTVDPSGMTITVLYAPSA